MSRFEYRLKEDGHINIIVKTEDQKMGALFQIDAKEILSFTHFLNEVAFAWCKKFKRRLDDPECC